MLSLLSCACGENCCKIPITSYYFGLNLAISRRYFPAISPRGFGIDSEQWFRFDFNVGRSDFSFFSFSCFYSSSRSCFYLAAKNREFSGPAYSVAEIIDLILSKLNFNEICDAYYRQISSERLNPYVYIDRVILSLLYIDYEVPFDFTLPEKEEGLLPYLDKRISFDKFCELFRPIFEEYCEKIRNNPFNFSPPSRPIYGYVTSLYSRSLLFYRVI